MKTNINMDDGLMTAALLGNTACTDLLHDSYGQVVSEDYVRNGGRCQLFGKCCLYTLA